MFINSDVNNYTDLLIIIISLVILYSIYTSRFKIFIIIIIFFILFYNYTLREPYICLKNISDKNITSPAYGKIISIRNTDTHTEITIFLSLTDYHHQYSPIKGVVNKKTYKLGEFKPALLLQKTENNERTETYISSEYGEIIVYQIAGMIFRTIVNNTEINNKLSRGDNIGLIKFGSQVRVFLPIKKTEIYVKKGDIVRGPETILGSWI
jgi:phosphatidylserine decarboxylase